MYREGCDIQHWMIWKTPLTSNWLRSPVHFTIIYAKHSKCPCISLSSKQTVWHYDLLLSVTYGTGTLIYPCPSSVLILNGRSRWNLRYFTTQQYLRSCHSGTFGLYRSKATVHILCYSAMPINLIVFHNFYIERASNNHTIVLTIKRRMYTCKKLKHGENHKKSVGEYTALDVQQPTIYDSRKTVKSLLPNETRPLLSTVCYRNLYLCDLLMYCCGSSLWLNEMREWRPTLTEKAILYGKIGWRKNVPFLIVVSEFKTQHGV
jgi:hypothetical protein